MLTLRSVGGLGLLLVVVLDENVEVKLTLKSIYYFLIYGLFPSFGFYGLILSEENEVECISERAQVSVLGVNRRH